MVFDPNKNELELNSENVKMICDRNDTGNRIERAPKYHIFINDLAAVSRHRDIVARLQAGYDEQQSGGAYAGRRSAGRSGGRLDPFSSFSQKSFL